MKLSTIGQKNGMLADLTSSDKLYCYLILGGGANMAVLKIRDKRWRLKEVPDVVESASDFINSYYRKRGLDGITIYDTNEIFINENLTPIHKLETYIHEITHAVLPNLKEGEVQIVGETLSRFLYRRGCKII